MNKSDLETLSNLRLTEAGLLCDRGLFDGAYYLAGYSVECGLKAVIAKEVKAYDFPDKDLAIKAYTHDLKKLVGTAGLDQDLEAESQGNLRFKQNWQIVIRWNEGDRYQHGRTEVEARELIDAIGNSKDGILQWVRTYW